MGRRAPPLFLPATQSPESLLAIPVPASPWETITERARFFSSLLLPDLLSMTEACSKPEARGGTRRSGGGRGARNGVEVPTATARAISGSHGGGSVAICVLLLLAAAVPVVGEPHERRICEVAYLRVDGVACSSIFLASLCLFLMLPRLDLWLIMEISCSYRFRSIHSCIRDEMKQLSSILAIAWLNILFNILECIFHEHYKTCWGSRRTQDMQHCSQTCSCAGSELERLDGRGNEQNFCFS